MDHFQHASLLSRALIAVAFFVGTVCVAAQSVEIETGRAQIKVEFGSVKLNPASVVAFISKAGRKEGVPATVVGTSSLVIDASLTNVVLARAEGKEEGRVTVVCVRWQPTQSTSEALLPLDLVPGVAMGEVRAFFQGKAAPRAQATFRMPSGDQHELIADAEGYFRFRTARPGRYILSMTRAGEQAGGTNYQALVAWSEL